MPTTTNWKLGRECALSIAGFPLALAKEVTVELSTAEADVTCRASQGVKRIVQAQRELTVSGTAVYSPDDPAVQTLVEAHLRGLPVAAGLSDPTLEYDDLFAVASLSQPQPLEDAMSLDFTLKATDGPLVFGADSGPGHIRSRGTTWSAAHDGSQFLDVVEGDHLRATAKCISANSWEVRRAYLRFDTSALAGITLKTASLSLVIVAPIGYATRTLRLRRLAADYETLDTTDFNAAETGDPVDFDIPASADDVPVALAIPVAWLDTSGSTCLTMRERTYDCADAPPPLVVPNGGVAYGDGGSGATGRQPKLLVWPR